MGDPIQIISGAFAGLRGTLLDVNLKRQEVKVAICLFDRETEAVLRIDEVVRDIKGEKFWQTFMLKRQI